MVIMHCHLGKMDLHSVSKMDLHSDSDSSKMDLHSDSSKMDLHSDSDSSKMDLHSDSSKMDLHTNNDGGRVDLHNDGVCDKAGLHSDSVKMESQNVSDCSRMVLNSDSDCRKMDLHSDNGSCKTNLETDDDSSMENTPYKIGSKDLRSDRVQDVHDNTEAEEMNSDILTQQMTQQLDNTNALMMSSSFIGLTQTLYHSELIPEFEKQVNMAVGQLSCQSTTCADGNGISVWPAETNIFSDQMSSPVTSSADGNDVPTWPKEVNMTSIDRLSSQVTSSIDGTGVALWPTEAVLTCSDQQSYLPASIENGHGVSALPTEKYMTSSNQLSQQVTNRFDGIDVASLPTGGFMTRSDKQSFQAASIADRNGDFTWSNEVNTTFSDYLSNDVASNVDGTAITSWPTEAVMTCSDQQFCQADGNGFSVELTASHGLFDQKNHYLIGLEDMTLNKEEIEDELLIPAEDHAVNTVSVNQLLKLSHDLHQPVDFLAVPATLPAVPLTDNASVTTIPAACLNSHSSAYADPANFVHPVVECSDSEKSGTSPSLDTCSSTGSVDVNAVLVGPTHQAVIPDLVDLEDDESTDDTSTCVWDPSRAEGVDVSAFLREAQVIKQAPRPKGSIIKRCWTGDDYYFALTVLHQHDYNCEEALKFLRKKVQWCVSPLLQWSEEECQRFVNGLKLHGKNFHYVQQAVGTRSMIEVIDFYYCWKHCDRFGSYEEKKKLANRQNPNFSGLLQKDVEDEALMEVSPWKRCKRERSTSPSRSLINSRHKTPPPAPDFQDTRSSPTATPVIISALAIPSCVRSIDDQHGNPVGSDLSRTKHGEDEKSLPASDMSRTKHGKDEKSLPVSDLSRTKHGKDEKSLPVSDLSRTKHGEDKSLPVSDLSRTKHGEGKPLPVSDLSRTKHGEDKSLPVSDLSRTKHGEDKSSPVSDLSRTKHGEDKSLPVSDLSRTKHGEDKSLPVSDLSRTKHGEDEKSLPVSDLSRTKHGEDEKSLPVSDLSRTKHGEGKSLPVSDLSRTKHGEDKSLPVSDLSRTKHGEDEKSLPVSDLSRTKHSEDEKSLPVSDLSRTKHGEDEKSLPVSDLSRTKHGKDEKSLPVSDLSRTKHGKDEKSLPDHCSVSCHDGHSTTDFKSDLNSLPGSVMSNLEDLQDTQQKCDVNMSSTSDITHMNSVHVSESSDSLEHYPKCVYSDSSSDTSDISVMNSVCRRKRRHGKDSCDKFEFGGIFRDIKRIKQCVFHTSPQGSGRSDVCNSDTESYDSDTGEEATLRRNSTPRLQPVRNLPSQFHFNSEDMSHFS